jgi:hypothetical protein
MPQPSATFATAGPTPAGTAILTSCLPDPGRLSRAGGPPHASPDAEQNEDEDEGQRHSEQPEQDVDHHGLPRDGATIDAPPRVR